MTDLQFALNRMVAPHLSLDGFLDLARRCGATAVEIRNDLDGQEIADGTNARSLAARVAEAGLKIASINALQRFNDWTPEREAEAVFLARYARDVGAPGIVLCPVVEAGYGRTETERAGDLRKALKGLKPIMADHGVIGFVEPLGMIESTMRFQHPAMEAIQEVDGTGAFSLCHDTFQHYRAADTAFHPHHTGLVHVSGIVESGLPRDRLREPHRGFVDANDIAGNVEQLVILLGWGYRGYVSHEPFDPAVHAMADPAELLLASIAHLRQAVEEALGG